MKVLLVVLCLVSTSLAYNMAWIEWTNFKALHHKVYKSQSEELFRLKMYLINKVAVLSQNIKYRNGHSSFDVEMNKFGDSLSHEIKAVTRGFVPKTGMIDPSATYYNNSQVALPSEVDHRKNKLVNPPREQGSCKSCWAFSATGAIEAQLARKTGVLLRLSQQQLLDCVIDSYGCDGGYMNSAFKYVQKHGGLVTEHIYSYTGEQGNCQVHNRKKLRAKVKGFVNIMPGNEDDLADAIHNIGPISSAIDSRSRMITFYKTGILDLDETQCSSSHVNHAVLVIGYGVEAGKQYWLIKNSWGTDWGEKGYIRIVKNGYNICGVATMPSYPVLE